MFQWIHEAVIYMANLWEEVSLQIKKKVLILLDRFAFLDFRRSQGKATYCLAVSLLQKAWLSQE